MEQFIITIIIMLLNTPFGTTLYDFPILYILDVICYKKREYFIVPRFKYLSNK